jgi:hypothetical protein
MLRAVDSLAMVFQAQATLRVIPEFRESNPGAYRR